MKKIKEPVDDFLSAVQFPVVGIGASAGGLEAITHFLQGVPENPGMAFVYVQHLSPNYPSSLPEILEKSAKIPVHLITDNIQLEPDNFYIIPVNKIVTAVDGTLKLAPLDDKHNKVNIIDTFFSSLALEHQSYAVGIILSGTLTDGTAGLEAIKTNGGITFAQDEASAAFDGMPGNAISSGLVDFVLSPEKMAEQLMSINQPFHTDYVKADSIDAVLQKDEDIFKQLLTVLRVHRGVDFTFYKSSTLKRRIMRRMALQSIKKPASYLAYLREHKEEQEALYNDMLISVTNFFRDPASFDLLCDNIFPALIKQKNGNESLRIWVAGCATGEEAYSLAICLLEYLGDKASNMKIQVFATDISEAAIAKARTGIYKPADMQGLSPARFKQFFTKVGGNYQVNKAIRDLCIFAHHNLLKDPPFSKVDLVSCRNVLIYLEPVLQKRVFTTFHYALNDLGYLMLGKSESVGKNTDLFTVFNNHEKIFRRVGQRGRFMEVTSQVSEQSFKDIDKSGKNRNGEPDVFKMADDVVLSEYAPAGALVNANFDIIQFRGQPDKWLSLSPGKASLNVLKMARDGLAFELRNLLHLAKRTKAKARKEGVQFNYNSHKEYVNLDVVPIVSAIDPHYLIHFEHCMDPGIKFQETVLGKSKKKGVDPRDLRIKQLENELLQARSDMKTVTEEQEAVNEELQSANEELLSGGEELQSLNEELETSKEELQSTNEEIIIVNTELIDRNAQLNNARKYAEGIISTLRGPFIIMDKHLKVKRATDIFYEKFKVSEKETEGEYIYNLGNKQWDIPDLRHLLEKILPEQKAFSNFEVSHVFPKIGQKIMLLNGRQLDEIYGDHLILLSIEDITTERKVEEGLAEVALLFKESQERLKSAVDAAGLGTWDYDPVTGELIWDDRTRELFRPSQSEEITYTDFIDLIYFEDRNQADKDIKQTLSGSNNGEYEKEFRVGVTAGQDIKWLKSKGKVYFNGEGIAKRFVGTVLDITLQKAHDEAISELLKKKDDFMSIASHELKTPITSLKAALQLLGRMKDNPSSKMSPMIDRANKSMDRITVLIEDLLNVSKISHGQLNLNKTRFIIAKVIDGCCDHIRMEDAFQIITTGDTDAEVYGDPERIDQVVVNFVNNAIKYASKSKEIRIDIQKINDMVKVSVSDKGPGIPPEKLPHLFERYFRVDSDGSQYSGLGLGLYICSEIIKRHGGQIGVDSKLGKGSTFWFTLPLE